jgi:acyl-CoA thioester hydrolase
VSVHRHTVRVYYEDTDMAGIVYHANHLRFAERGRSEWLRALGVDQAALRAEGTAFAVARMDCRWLAPARFDDLLTVETRAVRIGGARAELAQRILRGATPLFEADVTVAALGAGGRPVRLPAGLRATPAPS